MRQNTQKKLLPSIWTIEYLSETKISEAGIYQKIPRKIAVTKKYFLNRFVPQNLIYLNDQKNLN